MWGTTARTLQLETRSNRCFEGPGYSNSSFQKGSYILLTNLNRQLGPSPKYPSRSAGPQRCILFDDEFLHYNDRMYEQLRIFGKRIAAASAIPGFGRDNVFSYSFLSCRKNRLAEAQVITGPTCAKTQAPEQRAALNLEICPHTIISVSRLADFHAFLNSELAV